LVGQRNVEAKGPETKKAKKKAVKTQRHATHKHEHKHTHKQTCRFFLFLGETQLLQLKEDGVWGKSNKK
jgi:hypothetical protein